MIQNGNPLPPEKNLTITINRDSVINIALGLQLVLLLVFGWQLISIKGQLGSAPAQAKVIAQNPTQPSGGEPTGPAPVADIVVTTDDHVKGGENAKVTIVEYSDFECPFCGRAFPTVNQVIDTYGDDIRFVYRHLPLNSIHPQAQKAAEASECAADQGKFWQFHDKVFANQDLVSAGGVVQFKKWAGEIGLNTAKFNTCLDSGSKAAVVQADEDSAQAAGVTSTPAFFINGISVVGAQPFSVFQNVIDEQLAQ
ncbi:MAG: DsbA family protein [Parcubacteria group bacterium]|nr:DsbA family protein [Parcubacteria group bacterium]